MCESEVFVFFHFVVVIFSYSFFLFLQFVHWLIRYRVILLFWTLIDCYCSQLNGVLTCVFNLQSSMAWNMHHNKTKQTSTAWKNHDSNMWRCSGAKMIKKKQIIIIYAYNRRSSTVLACLEFFRFSQIHRRWMIQKSVHTSYRFFVFIHRASIVDFSNNSTQRQIQPNKYKQIWQIVQ